MKYILTGSTRMKTLAAISQLNGEWEIEVTPRRKRRSDSQNKRYWKLTHMAADVVGCSPEELHEQMLGAYFGWQEVNIGPKRFRVPKQRSRLQSIPDFTKFMTWVEQKYIQYCGTWLE